MDSRTAAHVLNEIAALLELRAENRFKIKAYRTAAKAVLALDVDDLAPLLDSGALARVSGIGPATLAVVTDLARTRESRVLEQLRQAVPTGLLDLLRVPGLTPEKIQQLHTTLGIDSLDALDAAARDGRLTGVRGFGTKTIARLIEGIAFVRRTSTLALYPRAAAESDRLLAAVRRHPDVVQAGVAGSVRRRNEIVRNIDIVAAVRGRPEDVAISFATAPSVRDAALTDGSMSIRYVDGTRFDLRCVTPTQYAVALWRATGSAAHVSQITDALARRGLFLDDDEIRDVQGALVTVPDERALYALLGLAPVPPEMREGAGELAAAAGHLPQLVTRDDVCGVLHCHSTYSDGTASIADMARAARDRGWRYLGISDHSQSAFYAGGLRPDDIDRQHDEIDALNAELGDFAVLKGIEADILRSGHLDYDDRTLDRFDYVIGSVHSAFRLGEAEMTDRILTALDDPRLTILGHPTGRLLLSREAYPVNMDAVIAKAAETGVALELNADPHRLDLDWRCCRLAKTRGVPIAIGPDAHSTAGLDNVDIGIGIARKGWLAPGDILNARSADAVVAFASARRVGRSTDRTVNPPPPSSDADIPF